jgi:hypothetical protein
MGKLYNSGITALNEAFQGIYDDFMRRKGDESQSPAQIAKEFPIEIISYDDIFDVLHEAVQKKAYGHYGCFFEYEQSNVARDGRITRPKVFRDFRQIVCLRGEVYEFVTKKGNSSNTFTCDNGEWRERKVYQDIRNNWHLWDGRNNIEIWGNNKQQILTNPPKPTKIYPAE